MIDSRFNEFLEIFDRRVRKARLGEPGPDGITPLQPREVAFTSVFMGDMEDIGLVADTNLLYFERKLGRANAKLNAYALSDDERDLTLVVAIHGAESPTPDTPANPIQTAASQEIGKSIKAALHVFRAASSPVFQEMENSCPERDMMEHLHSTREEVSAIRILIIVDGTIGRTPAFEQPEGLPSIIVDIWDLERLFRATSSGLAYESVTIELEDILGSPLPCLPGPEAPEDHQCFLALIPGILLHDLYHEHGPRLLELNVRSFLQARGKVNRGIRDTLQSDPEYFLAYNNGISATVEDLDLTKTKDGTAAIRSMKGLQIVNGGQTMASIHRAKDRDKVSLEGVFVQAKITKIRSGVDDLVPMISRFSNTQNNVNETDFSANHPFHVRLQQLSEKVWAPGEVTRWFYERARGQWEVARLREGATPSKLRAFDARTPRQQKIDKNILAKTAMAWNELPHTVSLGGQKCFVAFMKSLEKNGVTWEPDENYYRDMVSKIIVFKRAEKIARQIGFSAYRANAVSYTISLIAYRTSGRLLFSEVWENQDVIESLEKTIRDWMPRVHEEIVETADGRNVTEWCKKKDCWAMIQSLDLEFDAEFENDLAKGQPLPNVGRYRERRSGSTKVLSQEERARQARVMKISTSEWQKIIGWMASESEYAGFPVQISGTVLGYSAAGWKQVPSPKQTAQLVKYIDAWQSLSLSDED